MNRGNRFLKITIIWEPNFNLYNVTPEFSGCHESDTHALKILHDHTALPWWVPKSEPRQSLWASAGCFPTLPHFSPLHRSAEKMHVEGDGTWERNVNHSNLTVKRVSLFFFLAHVPSNSGAAILNCFVLPLSLVYRCQNSCSPSSTEVQGPCNWKLAWRFCSPLIGRAGSHCRSSWKEIISITKSYITVLHCAFRAFTYLHTLGYMLHKSEFWVEMEKHKVKKNSTFKVKIIGIL